MEYLPFGETLVDEHLNSNNSPFKFNGKEFDEETGNYYYAARYYDPKFSILISVDPLADKTFSAYGYCYNNPINMTDPTGMSAEDPNPIYDPEGNFLGTDDRGLEGLGIVMAAENFTQGMSGDEADACSIGPECFNSPEAHEKASVHHANLKNRPDYDGIVTIDEGVNYALKHPNTKESPDPNDALYLDASIMDFGNLKSSNMSEGVTKNYNLFNYTDYMSNNSRYTTYALGNTQMTLLNSNEGTVKLYSDVYDWDYHDKSYRHSDISPPSSKRDRLVWGDRMLKGLDDSHGFKVYIYGIGILRK